MYAINGLKLLSVIAPTGKRKVSRNQWVPLAWAILSYYEVPRYALHNIPLFLFSSTFEHFMYALLHIHIVCSRAPFDIMNVYATHALVMCVARRLVFLYICRSKQKPLTIFYSYFPCSQMNGFHWSDQRHRCLLRFSAATKTHSHMHTLAFRSDVIAFATAWRFSVVHKSLRHMHSLSTTSSHRNRAPSQKYTSCAFVHSDITRCLSR